MDCEFVPYWHTSYEQFILPAFAVTAREEQYPSRYWLENPPMLEPENHAYYPPGLSAMVRLFTGQQYEPKAPWKDSPRLNGTPLEADPYKSVKTMTRTIDRKNENFIPLTRCIKEGTNTVVGFLDQLLSKKSIPIADISDLLAEWSKYMKPG